MLKEDRELLERDPEYQRRQAEDRRYAMLINVAAGIKREALKSGFYLSKTQVEDGMMAMFPDMDWMQAHQIMNHIEMHNLDSRSS